MGHTDAVSTDDDPFASFMEEDKKPANSDANTDLFGKSEELSFTVSCLLFTVSCLLFTVSCHCIL